MQDLILMSKRCGGGGGGGALDCVNCQLSSAKLDVIQINCNQILRYREGMIKSITQYHDTNIKQLFMRSSFINLLLVKTHPQVLLILAKAWQWPGLRWSDLNHGDDCLEASQFALRY